MELAHDHHPKGTLHGGPLDGAVFTGQFQWGGPWIMVPQNDGTLLVGVDPQQGEEFEPEMHQYAEDGRYLGQLPPPVILES